MDKHLEQDFKQYMRSVATAAMLQCHDPDGLYHGPEGAKRLGRECGPAILGFFGESSEKNIGSTYGGICVIAYRLKPPINANEWFDAMREGIQKAKGVVIIPIPENYTPAPMRLDGSPDTYKALWRGAENKEEKHHGTDTD